MPDRNLALALANVTEAAALAASRYVGLGDKVGADQAGVDAMRVVLSTVNMDGIVVIGEGEKDQAPMLYRGERVGNGCAPLVDVAVDPVEGTSLLASGRPNSIAVIAVSEQGKMWKPGPSLYMKKIVVEGKAKHAIDIRLSVTDNLNRVAEALGRTLAELTVFVLDKPRHQALIAEIRQAGARVALHTDGDVVGALLAASPNSGIDLLMGTGGTPEGVISAVAIKALRGGMQAVCDPQKPDEWQAIKAELGHHADAVLTVDQLIQSDDAIFAATGITDGPLLQGVHDDREGITTHSIVIRALSGSQRQIKTRHALGRQFRLDDVIRLATR